MNKEKKKKDQAITGLDIVIVILILVIMKTGFTAAFYKSRADRLSFTQDSSHLSFDLQSNDYASLIQGKYINEFNGDKDTGGYHALADYIEAASMYKVYNAKGYTDRAEQEKSVMEKSRAAMNELTVFADKADKMFGIEE